MSQRGFPPAREQANRLLDQLIETVDGGSDAPAGVPAALRDLGGTDEALACLSCLRQSLLEQIERDGPAAPLALARAADAQIDRWIAAFSMARQEQIQESLTTLNRDLNQQLSERAKTLRGALTRLENLERTKSDFVSIAAHELKTPLTLVRGYASILSEEAKAHADGRHVELVAGIMRGTERLGRLIDDLIDVAAIDLNMLELHRGTVFIEKLVTMAIAEVYSEAPGRHHCVTVHALDGLPSIEGDTQRLYQVLLQLIGNAMKFTPDGGRIDISGRLLYSRDALEAERVVQLSVADTGIGIDPKDHETIFEKFYRIGDPSLHSTSKARFKGAGPGLGLTIARGIVRAHGGAIWAESEGYDEERCPGSCFHILLPVQHGRSAAQTEELLRRQLLRMSSEDGPSARGEG